MVLEVWPESQVSMDYQGETVQRDRGDQNPRMGPLAILVMTAIQEHRALKDHLEHRYVIVLYLICCVVDVYVVVVDVVGGRCCML